MRTKQPGMACSRPHAARSEPDGNQAVRCGLRVCADHSRRRATARSPRHRPGPLAPRTTRRRPSGRRGRRLSCQHRRHGQPDSALVAAAGARAWENDTESGAAAQSWWFASSMPMPLSASDAVATMLLPMAMVCAVPPALAAPPMAAAASSTRLMKWSAGFACGRQAEPRARWALQRRAVPLSGSMSQPLTTVWWAYADAARCSHCAGRDSETDLRHAMAGHLTHSLPVSSHDLTMLDL